ncbi:MAG: hypothetical protein HY914_21985 [Desulfomonile tiedjei]|nr:hypothetical protein [Desulfomonile tiedjei]
MKKWSAMLIGLFAFTTVGAGELRNLVSFAVSPEQLIQDAAASIADPGRTTRTMQMAAEEVDDEESGDEKDSTEEDSGAGGKDRIGDAPKLG